VQSLFPTAPSALTDEDLAGLYAYPVERRWVRANFVSTLDGTVQGADGRAGSISPPADQRLLALMRSLCDVILVGAGTARAESYQPVQPHEVDGALRRRLGLAPVPTIVVVSHSPDPPDGLAHGEGGPVEVISAASGDIDPRAALEELSRRGYQRVLCEGGPRLMRDLVATGCCDELCLTIAAVIVAGPGLRMTHGPLLHEPVGMTLRHVLEEGGALFCRYTRMRG
jgi:riboflavin biosynthesis pyrimidine reductase